MDTEGLVGRVDHVLSAGRVQAVAVGVVVDDAMEVICRGGVDGRAVTARTSFYAASVTKQVIGLLLARAAGVDDPVRRWLPELPDWVEPVRLRHLVHHTSDLPDVTTPPARYRPATPRSSNASRAGRRSSRPSPGHATPTTTPATSSWPRRWAGCRGDRSTSWPRPSCSGHSHCGRPGSGALSSGFPECRTRRARSVTAACGPRSRI
ncbi:serine hydrolase [Ruania sp. N2-46]|uniref:Serine hydrolase n=1 Tax=Occultella gossypii TaxID=2800820 RepID=A0ABS7S6W7_9MICO|nr:serine hydrolase [Occultella gossypii]